MDRGGGIEPPLADSKSGVLPLDDPRVTDARHDRTRRRVVDTCAIVPDAMGSLIKKRRKRMRKKKHRKMLKKTRWQRRAAGK